VYNSVCYNKKVFIGGVAFQHKKMPAPQSKAWPFTWFPQPAVYAYNAAFKEHAEDALDVVKKLVDCEDVQYLVCQAEACPTSQRLHIQGYIEVVQRWTFTRVKEKIFKEWKMDNVSLRVARGSSEENTAYCTKDESRVKDTQPFVHGMSLHEPGERHPPGKSLDRVFVDIKAGMSMEQIIEKYGFGIFVRHERAINSAMCSWGAKRDKMPKIVLLVGKTGTGKSKWVHRKYPVRYRMTFGNGGNSAWFDGYRGEDVIELSEFRGQLQLAFMLDLLDRYELKVQTKGGTVQCLASTIVITSNDEPSEWYRNLDDREEKLKPLLRRIEEFGERPRYMTENRVLEVIN